eukprot:TRINITY_DN33966_c0_g1_i1.p1 TRINITY_DN33966_c0_g1~~TRINITY_DN33966_c0_g1_i1.p1  ORF type:complete len:113 (-),score=21.33 TRINITY_DN33966_c0_g1_i1:29-367(-)
MDKQEAIDNNASGAITEHKKSDLETELPSEIHQDALGIQNMYETETLVKEEKTKANETEEGDIPSEKSTAKLEKEDDKEEPIVSVLCVWFLVLSFTVFCNLNVVKYLVLELN